MTSDALTPRRAPPPGRYALQLLSLQPTWGLAVIIALVAGASSAVIAAPALGALGLATWLAATHPRVQRALERRGRRIARRERRIARETRLEEADAPRAGLAELTDLADAIARHVPGSGLRDALESVLDRYAELAIARARIERAVAAVDHARLLRTAPVRAVRAGDIRARRLAHWNASRARWRALDEELATITDGMRLRASRAALASRVA